MTKQKTILKEVSMTGKGIHTGHNITLLFKPAAVNEGIRFIRKDLPGQPVIKLANSQSVYGGDAGRYSAIKNGDAVIYTVEHLLSVLCGLEIDNMTIEIEGDEVPGFDGSGQMYVDALRKAGVVELSADKKIFAVKEPICVSKDGAAVMIFPADEFKISYTLDYPNPHLKQVCTMTVNAETFEKEIASCRTFCLEEEAQALLAKGLGQGATYENTLVFGPSGVIKNVLRYKDEPARHKILDCIGDLYLLGIPIRGHVFAFRSGHALNRELLKRIDEQRKKYESRQPTAAPALKEGQAIDIQGIMKIIPHRYPFLLVDRIVEFEAGKRAVAIKNVTINEAFFQGHFPVRPVLPGVLMVEAMAQVAGVVALSNPELQGKLAFFMSVDGVKFRRVVEPGDQLVMEVEIVKAKSRIAQAKGVCKVDGQVVCEALMGFAFGE